MTWPQRARFAAGVACLTAVLFMAATAWHFYGQDFRGFYAAARVFVAGGNPYDYSQVASVLAAVTGRQGNNPYYYPPWFVLLCAPLAWLPFPAARAAWLGLNAAAWIAGLWAAARALGWPGASGAAGGWAWGAEPALFLLATWSWAWVTLRFEQTGLLMFALLAAAQWCLRTGRDRAAGALLALMFTKPTAGGLAAAAVLVWAARQGRPAVWRTAALVLAGLLAVGTALVPGWLSAAIQPGFGRGLTQVLDGPLAVTGVRLNSTLLDWLSTLGLTGPLAWSIYAAAAGAALAATGFFAWRSASPALAASVAVAAQFWASPYALQYDFPLLAWALFWALSAGPSRPGWTAPWRAGAAVLVLGLASVPVWERPISDGFWMVIAVTALLLWRALCGGNLDRA